MLIKSIKLICPWNLSWLIFGLGNLCLNIFRRLILGSQIFWGMVLLEGITWIRNFRQTKSLGNEFSYFILYLLDALYLTCVINIPGCRGYQINCRTNLHHLIVPLRIIVFILMLFAFFWELSVWILCFWIASPDLDYSLCFSRSVDLCIIFLLPFLILRIRLFWFTFLIFLWDWWWVSNEIFNILVRIV